jgi:hypothetical protein
VKMMQPTKMKQGTLFSFFSKKSNGNTGTDQSAATGPSPPYGAETVADTKSNGTMTSKIKPDAYRRSDTTSTSSTSTSVSLLSGVHVGSRIAVFWPDDRCYYSAVVSQIRRGQKASSSSSLSNDANTSFYLEYDDGQCEWIKLASERWRFDAAVGVDGTKSLGKKPAPYDDVDEEEIEFQLDDDDDDESTCVAPQNGSQRDHDIDDSESQWMVTDDEDDALASHPKKKNAPTTNKSKQFKRLKSFHVTEHAAMEPDIDSINRTPTPKPSSSLSLCRMPSNQYVSLDHFRASATTETPKSVTPTSGITPDKSESQIRSSGDTSIGTPRILSLTSQSPLTSLSDGEPLSFVKGAVNPLGSHVHNHLPFVRQPKDAQGRSTDHPQYDRRTLLLNLKEWEKHNEGNAVTPAMLQWWEIKSQYFDTVLLFKTGTLQSLGC